MTNGQSTSLSWCQATIWGPWPIFINIKLSWSWSWNYVTTNCQPASLSWCLAPMTRFFYCQTVQVHWCGAPSLMRAWVWNLQLLLGLTSRVILGTKSCRTHNNTLLSQIRESPNLENQVSMFIFPTNKVAQLYSQALSREVSESKLYYNQWSIGQSLGDRNPSGTHDQFCLFFSFFHF
jgi:hypothetical protein